ncbi:MAG TPA: MBL fold metallo-hydrolase [Ktedonobacteraceae bacterium]
MRVISLASGSSGNALFVEAGPAGRTKLLVDAGISTYVLTHRLLSFGVNPKQLQGILITHEHSDHVLGVPLLMKRYAIPVIADMRTYNALEASVARGAWQSDGGVPISLESTLVLEAQEEQVPTSKMAHEVEEVVCEENERYFRPLAVGAHCQIGDIEITSFATSHDAVAPCGFLLHAGGCRVCVVTDCGEIRPAMLEIMRLADLLVIEANHDRTQLLRGPYPHKLKMRILSATGHLSNDQSAEAILHTWHGDSVRWLWLAHLSRTNNTPALALRSVRTSLQAAGADLALVHVSVAPPGMGPVWDSTQLWNRQTLWEMPAV